MSGVQAANPGPNLSPASDPARQRLEAALTELDSGAVGFAVRFIQDAGVRQQYRQSVRQAGAEISADVAAGRITPEQGAMRAQQLRNEIMALARARTSDLGRAMAERLKFEGKTFEELTARYAARLFKQDVATLTLEQRDVVMREIIAAAARDNAQVSGVLRFLGPASRGVMALSLGLAVYDVYRAPDRPKEALHQGVVMGAGLGGSYVVGAVATSFVCGPGAPVCAGIFIAVGAIGFSAGADYFWRRLTTADGRQ
jgi:hypothetical protein